MDFLFALAGSNNMFGDLKFTTEHIMESLKIMAIGMGGIFAALLIIYLASVALQKIFPEKK